MAQFTNQAQLTYRGQTVVSNVTVGEMTDHLSVQKTPLKAQYAPGDTVGFVVSLINSGTEPLTGVQVTDDLGAVAFAETTVTPLTYQPGSVQLFSDGVPQPAPTVEAEAPLTVTGITVPAQGEALLIYAATVNQFAPPGPDGSITNTVTVTDNSPMTRTAQATITAAETALLRIGKQMDPVIVAPNDTLTYTFQIENVGNAAADTDVILTDTFNPALTDLTVEMNGSPLARNSQYSYDSASGVFATAPGVLAVPAAAFTQDPVTGAWSVQPGSVTVTVSGTV